MSKFLFSDYSKVIMKGSLVHKAFRIYAVFEEGLQPNRRDVDSRF